jgi:hypothetical protein
MPQVIIARDTWMRLVSAPPDSIRQQRGRCATRVDDRPAPPSAMLSAICALI